MKKIVLITTLILLFVFSTPIVKSPFVNLPKISNIKPIGISQGGMGILSTKGTCYVPPWTDCDAGYECSDNSFYWLWPRGKKIGWSCGPGFSTDPGLHNYKMRVVMDIILLYTDTVTSKALFNGTYFLNITPTGRISSMSSSIDFNYSHTGIAYLFEPSYVSGQNAAYLECAIMWINFTQTDNITMGVPILYKMYINDLNRDDHIDVFDAVILSNGYGLSWSSPVNPNDNIWRADINSDGIINTGDAVILKSQIGTNYIKPVLEDIDKIWEPMWVNTLDCMSY